MTDRSIKRWVFAAEIIGGFAAVIAAFCIYIYWRAQSGPVAVDILRPGVELLIDTQIGPSLDSHVSRIHLYKDDEAHGLKVTLSGVAIIDKTDTTVAQADRVTLGSSIGDIFLNRTGPQSVIVEGAALRIQRGRDQRITVPKIFGTPANGNEPRNFNLHSNKLAFQHAEIRDATVIFEDVASARSWTSTNASILVDRSEEGLHARLGGDISMGVLDASLDVTANYAFSSNIIDVVFIGERFPLADIFTVFFGERAGIVDAPVSGAANVRFSLSGAVEEAMMNAEISDGTLRLANANAPIKLIRWESHFDPAAQEFLIDSFEYDVAGNSGTLTGTVDISQSSTTRALENIDFTINANDVVLNLPNRLEAPLSIDATGFSGSYQLSERIFSLEKMTVATNDVSLNGNIKFIAPRAQESSPAPSPGITANIAIDGQLNKSRLLKIWPLGVGSGARDWVAERVEFAQINNMKGIIDIPIGQLGEDGFIPDEAIDVTFDVSNAKAYYAPTMTPLTDGAGIGRLRGNSFKLVTTKGAIGDVRITKGEVEFPEFIPKWRPSFIRVTVDGASEDILAILDEPPLNLLSKTNLSPGQFIGDAIVDAEIMRPNKRHVLPEEYEYRGNATFENLTADDIFGNASLTGGSGTVQLEPRFLIVKADAKLAQEDINITWRKNFFHQDGPSQFDLSGVADSTTGDLVGFPLRQYIHGPFEYDISVDGEIGDWETVRVSADFTQSAVTLAAFNWRKQPQSKAIADIEFSFTNDAFSIPKLNIDGDDIKVDADFRLGENSSIEDATIRDFWLRNAADISATLTRDDKQQINLNILGRYLNADQLLTAVVNANSASGDQFTWGNGIKATARVDELQLRNDVRYRVASFDLWRSADRLEALNFTAFEKESNTPLTVRLSQSGDAQTERSQTISVESGNIGAFMRSTFDWAAVGGGDGVLAFTSSSEQPGLTGTINARNVSVNDAPFLARLFSAGSFQGIASLLSGEGIQLTNIDGAFTLQDQRIQLSDFRASGPSIGVTADGIIAIDGDQLLDLQGSVAPLYQVNSLLGSTPIIGDIFVGKEGEGMVALSYNVTGERDAPVVTVNPFTALTPGIFRQIFQSPPSALDDTNSVNDDDAGTLPSDE